jgi:AcrR family transcriptional regulator
VRDRLLESASNIFSRKGYAAATVREIVEAAGVTKPVLYYYFNNKEGLFREMVENSNVKLLALLEKTKASGGTIRQKILRLMDDVFMLYFEELKVVNVFHSVFYGPREGAPNLDLGAFPRKFHEEVRSLMVEGIGRGELVRADPDELMMGILGPMSVFMFMQRMRPGQGISREGLARILNHFFDGIMKKTKVKKS